MVQAVTALYITGRETKRTKHCRGVAPQTEPLAGRGGTKREGAGRRKGEGEREREAETERTKTWNKSPHFCSLESFSNYGRNGEERQEERMAVRGGPSVIYTLRRFWNY